FVSFAESPAGILVRVRDRASGTLSVLRGDVLVGADGLYSQVRAQLHPGEPPPRWGGVMMWRGMAEGAPFLTGRTVAVAGTNVALKFVAYPISRQAERRGRALPNWVAEVKLPGRAPVRDADGNRADWNRQGRPGYPVEQGPAPPFGLPRDGVGDELQRRVGARHRDGT